MKKMSNPAAYYSRLKQLAEVNKSGVKNSQNYGLGTLIDYKKSSDGVAYGIIKENHHYYIKKGGLKENLDVSDFTYIGGMENITEYRYDSLANADKKRNMMLHVLNESADITANKSKTKLSKNEDVVDDKLKSMENSSSKLDQATATEKQAASQPQIPDLGDTDKIPDGDIAPESTENPDDGEGFEGLSDETPEEGGEETPTEPISEDDYNEAKSELGKAVALFADKKLDLSQVETILNTIVTPLKKNLVPLEVEQRKDLAKPIIGAENVNGEEYLENTMPDEETGLAEDMEEGSTQNIEDCINKINDIKKSKGEKTVDPKLLIDKYIGSEVSEEIEEENTNDMECNECGTFGKYAESRGYSKKALVEASNDEKASIISGYINAFNEGKNHGEAKVISVFAKKAIVESLINDYGHNAYVESKLKPQLKTLNESTFKSRIKLLNEEFEEEGIEENIVGSTDEMAEAKMKFVEELKKLTNIDDEKKKEMMGELFGDSLNEDEINELFGSLGSAMGSLGNLAGKGIKGAAKGVAKGVSNVGSAVGNAASNVGKAVGNAATAVGNEYQKGYDVRQRANSINQAKTQRVGNEKNLDTSLENIKDLSTALATAIAEVNANRKKLGKTEITLPSVMSHLSNQLRSKSGNVNLDKFRNESKGLPTGTVEVQPNMLQEIEDDDELEIEMNDETPEVEDNDIEALDIDSEDTENEPIGFAPDSANMGFETTDRKSVV